MYPVRVAPASDILVDLAVHHIPGRNPLLPIIYVYQRTAHREHPAKLPSSKTYVYLVDPSRAGKEAFETFTNAQKVPGGFTSDLIGLLELFPGDALLARPIDRDGSPQHDVLQALYGIDWEAVTDDLYATLRHATRGYSRADLLEMLIQVDFSRELALGSREDREKDGKTSFERSGRAEPVGGSQRCYGVTHMVQRPRQVTSPPAALKMNSHTPDAGQEMIRQLVQACSKFNSVAWAIQCPPHLHAALEDYAEQTNAPRFGCPENCTWYSMQLNHATPQAVATETSQMEEMGQFGGDHIDKKDAGMSHSCALGLSDLGKHEKAEPGRFHLLGQGVFMRIRLHCQFFFSGLLRHGGTAPLVAEASLIRKWAIRMLLISYPSIDIVVGHTRHSFASLPYQEQPLHITPEMTGAPHTVRDGQSLWSNHTTAAQDAWTVTDEQSHFEFMVRGMFQQSQWMFRQLPEYYGCEIDYETFRRAFTMQGSDGRVAARPWVHAPNPTVRQPFGERHREVQQNLLVKEYDRYIQGIPFIKENNPGTLYPITTNSCSVGIGRVVTTDQGKKRVRNDDSGSTNPSRKRTKIQHTMAQSHVADLALTNYPSADQSLNYLDIPSVVPDLACVDTSDAESEEPTTEVSRRLAIRLGKRPQKSINEAAHNTTVVNVLGHASQSRHDNGDEICDTSSLSSLTSSEDSEHEDDAEEQGRMSFPKPAQMWVELPTIQAGRKAQARSMSVSDGSVEDKISRYNRKAQCDVFASRFSLAAVLSISADVKVTSDNLSLMSVESLRHALSLLDQLDAVSPTLAPSSVVENLRQYYSSLSNLRTYCQGTDVWSNFYRQRLMLSEHRIVATLRKFVRDDAMLVLNNIPEYQRSKQWLPRLVLKVQGLVKLDLSVHVKRSQYIKTDTLPDVSFQMTAVDVRARTRRAKLLSPVTYVSEVTLEYVQQILEHWFGVPVSMVSQAQSALVHVLLETVGTGCLLLPWVWKIYSELPRWLFTSECPPISDKADARHFVFLPQYLNDFKTAMLASGSVQSSRAQIDDLHQSFIMLQNQTTLHVKGIIQAQTQPRQLRSVVTAMTRPSSDGHTHIIAGISSGLGTSSSAAVPPASALMHTALHTGLSAGDASGTDRGPGSYPSNLEAGTGTGSRVDKVVVFLRDAYAATQTAIGAATSSLNTAQQQLLDNSDFLSPIREQAYSRSVMNKEMDKDFIRTREGLFSAMVFRCISFNTPAFRECPTEHRQVKFRSAEEFETYVAMLKDRFVDQPVDFYCNRRAFGYGIESRRLHRYNDYWIASHATNFKWPPEDTSWSAVWKSFKKFKEFDGKNGKRLEGIGDLVLYMLVADLHAGGAIDTPSIDEVGHVVALLRKGAMNGLEKLGYFEGTPSKTTLISAFRTFFEDVNSRLTAEERELFMWNPVTAEHTLCKFKRMVARGHYS
ncbi:hypothetical protein BDW22DRAFT_1433650 [Trametopsis cervina]|nr:hypothetical protein BDW22DRAFT_1433650 [Trametopsis cervina]